MDPPLVVIIMPFRSLLSFLHFWRYGYAQMQTPLGGGSGKA
jgi:hypothetical protein